jgi:hypothetical protein
MKAEHLHLLVEWYRRVVLTSQSHYNNAQRLARLNLFLGIPVACLSAAVGTSVFATLEKDVASSARIVLGLTSSLPQSSQAFRLSWGFSERADRHRAFGARYGALRREIEALLAREHIPEEDFKVAAGSLLERMDALAEQAPHIPSRIFLRTEERYRDRFKTRFPDVLLGSHPSDASPAPPHNEPIQLDRPPAGR